jgi:gliding motility-associated-like protein
VWIEDDWVTDPGIYTYTHHNPVTMCDTVFDYHVTVSDPLLLSGETSWSCVDMGTIVIHPSGTGPFSIYWWNGGPQDTIVTGLGEGVFTVQVSDVFGCSIQDTFEVAADDALSFALSSVHQVPVGDSIWLEVEGDVNEPGLMFQWNGATYFSCDTCSSTWAATTHDTVVTVLITDADGCTYELATELLLTEDSLIIDRLYVPNVFSPNGDGVNDFWRMYSDLDNTYVHELAIFDRWGTQMMGKYDFDLDSFEGWDGTFKGRSVRPAVYAFVSKLTLGDGQEVYVKGNITLIK